MSMLEAVGTPPRMHLIDLTTGEDREVMFNPEQISETIAISYSAITVPGMSHQPLNYTFTGNHAIPIELYFQASTLEGRLVLDDWRRFILSLGYPKANAGTISDGAPPRVMFVWPNVWSFVCVLKNITINASSFSADDLRISRYTAAMQLEEIRDVRLTSEEVRRNGTRRSASGNGADST